MEKRKKTLFVSFATQKGGVGKSTFTIYAASWLHYVKGLNVAVVDCDYPQHSIIKQKKRDMEVVKTVPVYQSACWTVGTAGQEGLSGYRQ